MQPIDLPDGRHCIRYSKIGYVVTMTVVSYASQKTLETFDLDTRRHGWENHEALLIKLAKRRYHAPYEPSYNRHRSGS